MPNAADYYQVQRSSYDPGMGLDEICDALNQGLYIGSTSSTRLLSSSNVSFAHSATGALTGGTVQGTLRLFVHTSQFSTRGNYQTARDALSGTTGISGADAGNGGVLTNTLFGGRALESNTSGSSNAAFGYSALLRNTIGFGNSAFGRDALAFCVSGEDNAAFGRLALNFSTANGCSAFGAHALAANTSGLQNTAVGRGALSANTTGETNTAVGAGALGTHTNGNSNTTCGMDSLALLTSGAENTCLGADALGRVTTGSNNVALGKDAGRYTPALAVVTSISNCTFVGYLAKASATTGITNENVFGYLAEGFGSNTLSLGNASVTAIVPGDHNTADLGAASRGFKNLYAASVIPSVDNLVLGSGSALATTATAGYVMVPSCAGTPTGVPTGQAAGKIPMVFDTSGVKLWFYTGGAWKGVGVA